MKNVNRGAMICALLLAGMAGSIATELFFHSNTGHHPSEVVELIDKCEASLPRNMDCTLIAVPKVEAK